MDGKSGEQPLAIVGNAGGTNVGESLRRAALAAGHSVSFFDAKQSAGSRFLRSFGWHVLGRRPGRLKVFSADVVDACVRASPAVLIATGAAPLLKSDVRKLHAHGIFCVNYSTDDPWNPALRADWYLKALPSYNVIFTPRRANVGDFVRLGCRDVRYLPFGYDDLLFGPDASKPIVVGHAPDVLFVGGADRDRVDFATAFMRSGPPLTLVGAYWERHRKTRSHAIGHKTPQELRDLTSAAKVNLCLVRRANRDGHVMRSFEIAAMGGCMLAEDTEEHREIFGEDGECVVYFRSPDEAAARAEELLCEPATRARIAAALRSRIVNGQHTYRRRLTSMLCAAHTPFSESALIAGDQASRSGQ